MRPPVSQWSAAASSYAMHLLTFVVSAFISCGCWNSARCLPPAAAPGAPHEIKGTLLLINFSSGISGANGDDFVVYCSGRKAAYIPVMLTRTRHARTRTRTRISLTVTYCKLQLNLQSLSSNNNEHKVKVHNMRL